MRTAIYIDGYNLYYGVIHGTSYKWLDMVSLFTSLTKKVRQETEVVKVGYFTARVKAMYSKHGQDSYTAQDRYIRSLEGMYPNIFSATLGTHIARVVPKIKAQEPLDVWDRVEVHNIEEKKTDVNIALDMYRDAISGDFDQLVLVTSDSDLQPAVELIKADCSGVEIGVVLPSHPPKNIANEGKVRTGGSFKVHANWILNNIGEKDLRENQLPKIVTPLRGKNIKKPSYW